MCIKIYVQFLKLFKLFLSRVYKYFENYITIKNSEVKISCDLR